MQGGPVVRVDVCVLSVEQGTAGDPGVMSLAGLGSGLLEAQLGHLGLILRV